MSDRRRKKKKAKSKLAKLIKSLDFIKPRIPVPPVGYSHKSKKDYDRRENKKSIEKALKDDE